VTPHAWPASCAAMNDFEDFTFDLEEDGRLVRRQIERVVVAGDPYPVLMFLYEELTPSTLRFGPPKVALVRLQKWRSGYRRLASFTIAKPDQAEVILQTLARWMEKMGTRGETSGDTGEEADAVPTNDSTP